ncbi:hypothetical protein GOP47_0024331 [Adiantum capillus-veneris]|uniref:Uncharacterized protein n=1 Tax=Adiantum capillus-veneris TaxID=13818 RepID=A0A9D4U4A3_ADICA|nr:hypothetical protein GOP47_0024331 [Adiantum capillus-veneris]
MVRVEEEQWLPSLDGSPLRGGFERGNDLLWQILDQYTNRNDEYGADNGVLALLGSYMGRHVVVLERDNEFLQQLLSIFEAQTTRLKNRKTIIVEEVAVEESAE